MSSSPVSNRKPKGGFKNDQTKETHIPQVNEKHTAELFRPALVKEFLLSPQVGSFVI